MSVEKQSMQKHLLPLMRARWSLVCSVKTDPSPLIWDEETGAEKWSVSNKRWKRQEVVRCFRQSQCQRWWCWYRQGQQEKDKEMRSRRGWRRPNLGGSLCEENSQTNTLETDVHTGTERRTKNKFYILSCSLWYDAWFHLDMERYLQGQTCKIM